MPPTAQCCTPRDAVIYALGIGVLAGAPADGSAARYVRLTDPVVVPSMATVLGYQGFWVEQQPAGIDYRQVLHGSQGLVVHRPLAPCCAIRRTTRVEAVADKGADRGVWIFTRDEIADAIDGARLATLTAAILCRANGGCGSAGMPPPAPPPMPERAADMSAELPVSPQQAAIYQLSGDTNPLHVEPRAARLAGFPRPILHGLSTYGMACRALIAMVCDDDPAACLALDARFAAPVFPGDCLSLSLWRVAPGLARFRMTRPADGTTVLDHGVFRHAL